MITFDNSPTVYWLIGYALAGIVIGAGAFQKFPEKAFLVCSMLLLVFMRLPVIAFNRELNPDESQMLSHAITLFQDPVYWRSVDGTTIGPLDNYLLVLPRLLGLQIDYTSGRIMGLLCAGGSLLFLFYTLKNWFGHHVRWIFLVPVMLLAFTQEVDFVHYSSEQLPVFLLAMSYWMLSVISSPKRFSGRYTFLIGFVAGLVPFAKLQAVPLALVVAAMAFWLCYRDYTLKKDLKPALLLIGGGMLFPALVLIWTLSFGVFTDLIDFYLLGNVIYAGGSGFLSIPEQFMLILRRSFDFQVFTLLLAMPMLAGILRFAFVFQNKKEDPFIPVTIMLLVFSCIYAVTKSGNDFVHYLNFCFIPWSLLAGYGFVGRGKWHAAFPAIMLGCFISFDFMMFKKERKLNDFSSVNARELAESPVVKELKKRTRPGDYMVVWGWQCAYYVEAQLAQGTAENHSERSIFDHALRDKYRLRYLSDIRRTRPAVILDAVGKNSFWVQDPQMQDLRAFPALFTYVTKNYSLAGDFDGTRLYIRKDRL